MKCSKEVLRFMRKRGLPYLLSALLMMGVAGVSNGTSVRADETVIDETNDEAADETAVDEEKVASPDTPELREISGNRVAGVAINDNNFPNVVFRDYVASLDNGDGVLSSDEINSITEINVTGYDITGNGLKGIEYFTALEKLTCDGCDITEIHLENNRNLKRLFCQGTQISELNLSSNAKLEGLTCCFNQNLTSLNLEANTNLEYFNSSGCKNLQSVSFGNKSNLKTINMMMNNLSSIDVSGC